MRLSCRIYLQSLILVCVLCCLCFGSGNNGVDSSHTSSAVILLAKDAGDLETLAGSELQHYLSRLFKMNAVISNHSVDEGVIFELVIRSDLNDQEFLLRPEGNHLLLAGGSGRSLLWSVYELAEFWGVRYLIDGDVFPEDAGQLRFPEAEVRRSPHLRTRCWRLMNEWPHGPASWSLQENDRFLEQLAKMKFNRVYLSFWPCQPFVDYEFGGMKKPAGQMYFGLEYPIRSDMIGRELFSDTNCFMNPELSGASSAEELVKRGVTLARGILAKARSLGMETGIMIYPFQWPKEMIAVVPGSEPVRQVGNLTAGPGHDQPLDDPVLKSIVKTIFQSYAATYPQADYIHVSMPEHRSWTAAAAQAYSGLDQKYGVGQRDSFEALCARARQRTRFPGGPDRVEAMLKGDVTSLAFFDVLLSEEGLMGRSSSQLVFANVVPELFPLLRNMSPTGSEVLSFIDYTASRQLRQREMLRESVYEGLPANLTITLTDDNVGLLFQSAGSSIETLLGELRRHGWDGYYCRYWTAGDLDLAAHYLSRASWDDELSFTQACRDMIGSICGPESVTSVLEAFELLDQATRILDDKGMGFAFPTKSMVTKHYKRRHMPAGVEECQPLYRRALELIDAARRCSRPEGRHVLDYLAGRLTFSVNYLKAVRLFVAGAQSEQNGDIEQAARQAGQSMEAMEQAIKGWVGVVRDHGDIGAVALLNEYGYRPIQAKHRQLSETLKQHGGSHNVSTASDLKSKFKGFEVKGSEPDGGRYRQCRRMLVGPWCNQPEEYEGYNGFVGWPGVTRLKSGRWEVSFTSGSWHASPPWTEEIREAMWEENPEFYKKLLSWNEIGRPDIRSPRGGRCHIIYSDDEGVSWSKPKVLIDTALDDRHPTILELDDGTQLCMFFTFGWLPKEQGISPGACWMRSEDGGQTWSKPISPPGNGFGFGAGPAIQLEDGSVVWVSEGRDKTWGDKNVIFIYRSEDRGLTFERAAVVSTDYDLYEPTVAQLPDGRLVMMAREQGDISWSSDGGRTWTDPVSIGLRLFDPHLLMMPNGVLACFHGSYTKRRLRVILSPDGGQTWHGPGEGYGYSIDPSVYGYCHPIVLADGDVYVVYLKSGGHHPADARTQAIWGLGVRIHDDACGIDILPAPGQGTDELQQKGQDGGDPELGKQF